LGARKSANDQLHVFVHLVDRFRECDGRALFQQQVQRLGRFESDLAFFEAQLASADLFGRGPLFFGHTVEPHRSFVNLDLHFEHFAEANFEHGKHPFDFLFTQLPEDFFEFGNGLFQLAAGFFLLVDGLVAFGLFKFLLGLTHLLLSGFDAFASGIVVLLLLWLLTAFAAAAALPCPSPCPSPWP
jgi:hypothetical protein